VIAALLALALAADPVAEAERWPQDYAAQVAGARAATEPERALALWTRAHALSGGDATTFTALVDAALARGDLAEARRLAREAVDAHGLEPWPHLLRARALAAVNGPPSWRARVARRAVRHAVAVAPEDPSARCALAWNTAWLGPSDAPVAELDPTCDPNAQLDAAPRWRASASATAAPILWTDEKPRAGLALGARAAWDERAWVGLTARGIAAGEAGAQQELWVDAGGVDGSVGGRLLVGATRFDGGPGPVAVAGQAWASAGRLSLDGAVARTAYEDGEAWQAEASARWLLSSRWRASAGAQLTTHGGEPGLAPVLGLTLAEARWGVDLTVRAGRELRPLRIDAPVLWNLATPIDGSASLSARWVASPALTLGASVEALRRDGAWGAVPALGLTFTPGATR
jgi:hypothetical protein